jgi:hypothetical protein
MTGEQVRIAQQLTRRLRNLARIAGDNNLRLGAEQGSSR